MTSRCTLFSASLLLSLAALAGCTAALAQMPQTASRSCFADAGLLADTLFVERQVADASPPVPRPPHLAPYPPAAEGEYRLRFRGQVYIAWGMPVRVTSEAATEYRLVRLGASEQVPVYVLAAHSGEGGGIDPRIWAPITDTCVFLPFKHESEVP